MKKDMHVVLTIRVFTDKKSFGPGVARLLLLVDEHHSLRAAAKSMEMAYSKAWAITKNAEETLGFKLLESSTGGKGGGGAVLTVKGREFLDAYDRYCVKLKESADKLFEEEFGHN